MPPSPPPFDAAGADGEIDINPFTLAFRSPAVEGHFLGEVAKWRWPVLMFVFLFDCMCFTFRFAAKLAGRSGVGLPTQGEQHWQRSACRITPAAATVAAAALLREHRAPEHRTHHSTHPAKLPLTKLQHAPHPFTTEHSRPP